MYRSVEVAALVSFSKSLMAYSQLSGGAVDLIATVRPH